MRHSEGLYVIEPDRHTPYHCPRYQALLYKVLQTLKPQGYINLGDALDCPQASSHLKDPRKMNHLEADIESVNSHWDEIQKLVPKAVKHLLCGNHESRIERYILTHAKAAIGLIPSFPKLYGLKQRGDNWHWHPLERWNSLQVGDTVFHHGFYFDRHTAAQNLNRYRGVNFIQGHTHRVQLVHSDRNWSATLGHASDAAKIAHNPTPNEWKQAIGLFTWAGGVSTLEIYEVTNGAATVRGKLIKG